MSQKIHSNDAKNACTSRTIVKALAKISILESTSNSSNPVQHSHDNEIKCSSPVLVPRQIPDVLLGRLVAVEILKADAPGRRVRDLGRRHRKLHVAVLRQLLRYLVVRGQAHPADQIMRCVSA